MKTPHAVCFTCDDVKIDSGKSKRGADIRRIRHKLVPIVKKLFPKAPSIQALVKKN